MAARGVAEEPEDATKLELGPEFDDAQVLMIAEVNVVLDTYESKREAEGVDDKPNAIFEKCHEYCKRFNRFENVEAVKAVRVLLTGVEETLGEGRYLFEFEVGVLGNLVPDSAQEARALVPSLNDERNLTDEEIEAILFQLNSFKSMQG